MFVYKSDVNQFLDAVEDFVNYLLIADLAIFREWIKNDQRATTTPFSVGIESFCLKYFSNTKFVYRKIVELLVFAWTNIVTHLLQEFAFS